MGRKLGTLALLAIVAPAIWYFADLPDVAAVRTKNPTTSAIRQYRERQARDAGRTPHSLMMWRRLDQISPSLVHAVILSEDDGFYQHHGFDWDAMQRAAQINWERRRFAFGGSTLTQQLARSLYLSPRKNLFRKAKEALITWRLEKTLPKRRILELYLNVVEWGPQVYGAEAASRHFFHKSAEDLTPDEAVSLAAILPSPRRWDPMGLRKFMVRRKAILYDRMIRAGYIVPQLPAEIQLSTPPIGGEILPGPSAPAPLPLGLPDDGVADDD